MGVVDGVTLRDALSLSANADDLRTFRLRDHDLRKLGHFRVLVSQMFESTHPGVDGRHPGGGERQN